MEPIDRAVLEQLLADLGGDRQSLMELIGIFLDDAPKLLLALNAAARGGDVAALGAASHTLKSTSASMGARVMSGQCNRLQELASARNLAEATTLLLLLNGEFERVRAQLSTYYR